MLLKYVIGVLAAGLLLCSLGACSQSRQPSHDLRTPPDGTTIAKSEVTNAPSTTVLSGTAARNVSAAQSSGVRAIAVSPLLPSPTATPEPQQTTTPLFRAPTLTLTHPILPPVPAFPLTATPRADAGATGIETATATPGEKLILVPTNTPASTAVPVGVTPLPATPQGATLPSAVSPLNSYRASGSFTTTTTFADGVVSRQQGQFELTLTKTTGTYGADEYYKLTTARDGAAADTIVVYQVGDHTAVNYGENQWLVTPRGAGSPFANAIQPVVDLPVAFLRHLHVAQRVGSETVNGIATTHYQITDPKSFPALLNQPTTDISGTIQSLQFDGWVAADGGYVAKYVISAKVKQTPTLDANFKPVLADRSIDWSFTLDDVNVPIRIDWPAGAPLPGVISVPGFAPGAFPTPPGTEATSNYVGIPELASQLSVAEVSKFYQDTLTALGWKVEGQYGLYTCTKNGTSFTLIISADTASGTTRISVISGQ